MLNPSVTLLLCAAALAQGGQAPAGRQKWAFLVGVNKYQRSPKLDYAVSDVLDLGQQLVRVGFPPENIKMIADVDPRDNSSWPTGAKLREQLPAFLKRTRENDLVLVAFSGHGQQYDGMPYLVPIDASGRSGLISLNEVHQWLDGAQARDKVLLIDACRRGVADAGGGKPGQTFVITPTPGIYQMSSCKGQEWSIEYPALEHGVFMYHVVRGLKGWADKNRDGHLEMDELYRYTREETSRYVTGNQHPDWKVPVTQTPTRWVLDADHDIVIGGVVPVGGDSFRGNTQLFRFRDARGRLWVGESHERFMKYLQDKKRRIRWEDLSGADLRGVDLSGADLMGSNLRGADLTGATLVRADLSRAHCERANFSRTDLRGSFLIQSRFDGADLTGADLRGAHTAGAKLDKAILRK